MSKSKNREKFEISNLEECLGPLVKRADGQEDSFIKNIIEQNNLFNERQMYYFVSYFFAIGSNFLPGQMLETG